MTRLATFQACDEVASVGLGKFAFVGIYDADMLIPKLPFTLPQVFFVVKFRSPINDRPKKFKVRIERVGQPDFEVDNTGLLPESVAPSSDASFWQLQSIVRIAPFEIVKGGTLKVFVEDEHGDNYAGGLRIKVGVHPEASQPQIASTAGLVAAHFQRFATNTQKIKEKLACQLIEAMDSFMKHLGADVPLQFPNGDMRILLDDNRVHVFFPQRLEEVSHVSVEPGGNFEDATIEMQDDLGFIARFDPSAPIDLAFNYEIKASPKKRTGTRKN